MSAISIPGFNAHQLLARQIVRCRGWVSFAATIGNMLHLQCRERHRQKIRCRPQKPPSYAKWARVDSRNCKTLFALCTFTTKPEVGNQLKISNKRQKADDGSTVRVGQDVYATGASCCPVTGYTVESKIKGDTLHRGKLVKQPTIRVPCTLIRQHIKRLKRRMIALNSAAQDPPKKTAQNIIQTNHLRMGKPAGPTPDRYDELLHQLAGGISTV